MNDDHLSPKAIAAMRWQAIEGFNSAPGLSPMARRLGIALICTMDPKTRNCFPGEVRLATELGVHLSAIKKAKAELRAAKLVTWFNPGGPRHLSRYIFGWAALLREAKEAGERANLIVRKGLSGRRNGTEQGTNAQSLNSTRADTKEPAARLLNGTQIFGQGTQIEPQGTLQGTAIVPPRVPDITHDRTELDRAEHHHDEVGGAPSRRVNAPDAPFRTVIPGDQIPAKTMEEQISAIDSRKPVCHFPTLISEFHDEPETLAVIARLHMPQQSEADRLRATQGREAARAFILQQVTAGANFHRRHRRGTPRL